MRLFFTSILMCAALLTAGENLVKNGEPKQAKVTPLNNCVLENGAFKFVTNGKTSFSPELYLVDTGKAYEFTAVVRGEESSTVTFALQLFTEDKRYISPCSVSPYEPSLTKMLAPVKKGDTTMLVEDASKWDLKKGNIIAFNAKADLSDLPNTDYEYYVKAVKQTARGWAVELTRPLSRNHEASLVRLHSDGPRCDLGTVKASVNGTRHSFQINPGNGKPGAVVGLWWLGVKRVQLLAIPKGKSPIYLEGISLRELSKDELNRLDVFKCKELLVNERQHKEFIVGSGEAGFLCRNLEIPAKQARQLNFDFCSNEGGSMVTEVTFTKDGKESTYKAGFPVSVIPDGIYRSYSIALDEMAHWEADSTLTGWAVKFYSIQGRGKIGMASPLILSEKNLIPDAARWNAGVHNLDTLRPRATYLLEWKGESECPGIAVDFQNFMLKKSVSASVKMQKGARRFMFNTPKDLVRTVFTLKGEPQGGYPCLTLLDYKARFTDGKYWRGQWIWYSKENGPDFSNVWFYKEINLDAKPDYASLAVMADDASTIYINENLAGKSAGYSSPEKFEITDLLKPGKNEIKIRVYNGVQNAGLCCDIYASVNGDDLVFETDDTWRCKFVGKEQMPVPPAAEIVDKVFLYGDPAVTPPWCTGVRFRYAGPRGVLEPVSTAPGKIVARVLKSAPMKIDSMTLKRIFSNSDKPEHINILANIQGDFEEGNTITILYDVPLAFKSDAKIYLDDDYFTIQGNPVLAESKKVQGSGAGFQKAEFVNIGTRPMLKFRDHLYYPSLYLFTGNDQGRRMRPALETEYNNFRIIISFPEFWLDEDKYDFSALDQKMADVLNIFPDAIFMLDIRYYMPTWWQKANPDHASRTQDGTPRDRYENEQALGSKKWLTDSDKPVKALLDYVRTQFWCERIWGINVGESRNGEWFWGIRDYKMKPAMYGYSVSENAVFRDKLRKRYKTNEALQRAWKQKDVTFETATQPLLEEALKKGQGVILNPETDARIMDWYRFRNEALAEAIIHFCHFIKQETKGQVLCGAYYGYLVELAENSVRPQMHHGHNEFYQVAESPDVDFLRAPARYTYKKPGLPGGFMQPFTTNSLHKVLIYMENDERNSYGPHETWGFDLYTSRPTGNVETVGNFNREFAVSTVVGHSPYWMDHPRGSFYEKPIQDILRTQKRVYESLPPVQGLLPQEVAVVGDDESIYYSSSTVRYSAIAAAYPGIFIYINRLAAAYSVSVIKDLLKSNHLPAHKLYIMLPTTVLSQEQRSQLMARFEKEKAHVLWLHCAGADYPGKPGPNPAFNGDFLGMKFTMDTKNKQDSLVYTENGKTSSFSSEFTLSPHFYPESGYDEVLNKNSDGKPVLVAKRIGNSVHYFSSMPELPLSVLDGIFKKAGVTQYAASMEDPLWIGNDLIFLVARTGGEKRITLPSGCVMKAVIGPLEGVFASNEVWNAEPGMTYGFLVQKGEKKRVAAAEAKTASKGAALPVFEKSFAFTSANKGIPEGWQLNSAMKVNGKTSGDVSVENGILTFNSTKQYAALFTRDFFPCAAGQMLEATISASGSGNRFTVTAYIYTANGENVENLPMEYATFTPDKKNYVFRAPVKDVKGKVAAKLRFVIQIQPDTHLVCSGLKASIK